MLLFGHIGISGGVIKAYDILASMAKHGNSHQSASSSKVASIDYRIVLLGSLLPDIIDKPVWLFVSKDISLSGHDYAHTLLFNLVLLIGGLVLIRYSKSWLLIISLSSFMHLILDQMWNSPAVLLWPLLGSLPKKETAGWLSNIFRALFSYPEVYVPEIIGLVIVLLFACRLVIKKSVISFLKGGAID